jgi:alpha-galactosidase
VAHGLEIPLRYGVRQTYAENGGLGGFAHAARNIRPVLEIAHDMERLCPAAWFLKITNPMVRICDAIARYSRIKAVGLCHQIKAGYAMVGLVLADHLGFIVPAGFTDTHASPASIPPRIQVIRQALELVDIKAAGLNHFTWMLDLRDKRTGGDLYPLFAERWACFPYLARGAIVEVPGLAAGSGVHGLGVGALPEPVAELCRREITVG